MTKRFLTQGALTALAAALAAIGASAPARAQVPPPAGTVRPATDVALSVGTGRMVRLSGTMTDLFVANDAIADVQVRSANQIYIFGKSAGETSVYATDRAGRTIWSANVRVGTNIGSIDDLLQAAMPDAQIQARPINGMVLLTGTVAAPADVEEASRLVQAYVGQGTQVISRLKTATPLQVMLQVRIAEVSRSLIRNIGVNLATRDTTGGFLFGLMRGNPGTISTNVGTTIDPVTGAGPGATKYLMQQGPGTTLGAAGRLFGLDVLSSANLQENDNRVRILAEPNLTALSGETASFLAGGEFPIPMASGINGTSVEFKQYGVSLAFTPFVLEGGRISMRVRPEVSELSPEGSVQIGGFTIPGLTTRRVETTVELGSGQSFMIGGLLRNNSTNSIDKAPGLGSVPILGALFRSNNFRRNETELVIVVTPYLVRPVNAGQIALPTDGSTLPNTAERVLLGTAETGVSGARRPAPQVVEGGTAGPGIASAPTPAPAPATSRPAPSRTARSEPAAAPGFSF
ncbi:type II and III secretion system protein family protein [Sphingomonas parva]|uniref:Type II and III secretion system protein family protein n=1 Tax=Sphingomonas parva TaxID=2555898 RepID=A0A4Y8ZRV8_9SPHN|nr:type II and III secretion system protein family protein [Sphingomonas parva]TFI57865.1 type II and III secretion system protein family protein [Sphingomonas parva]